VQQQQRGQGLESHLKTRGIGSIGKEEMESGRAKMKGGGKGLRAEDECSGLFYVQ
jgi:hypothetical protein